MLNFDSLFFRGCLWGENCKHFLILGEGIFNFAISKGGKIIHYTDLYLFYCVFILGGYTNLIKFRNCDYILKKSESIPIICH